MTMTMQDLQLLGISKTDIQEIYEQALKDFKEAKTRIVYLDASYLYCFHLDDFQIIKKLNKLGRYDIHPVREWHACLERWLNDQTVILGNKHVKPLAIQRTLDRVTTEGMEYVAGSVTGTVGGTTLQYRSIGDGDVLGDSPSPSARVLSHEVDRINVNTTPEGGSLSVDGSVIYSIGNHSKDVPTPDGGGFTECGMEDTDDPTTDILFDYSIFQDAIPHEQFANAPGSTTVIYQCSG